MAAVSDNGSGGSVIKIIAIVVVLVAAGYFAMRGRSNDEGQPDDPANATSYICLDDGHVFKLTPKAFEELGKRGGIKSSSEEQYQGVLMVECPTTKTISAVMALECPNGKFVPLQDRAGHPGECPE